MLGQLGSTVSYSNMSSISFISSKFIPFYWSFRFFSEFPKDCHADTDHTPDQSFRSNGRQGYLRLEIQRVHGRYLGSSFFELLKFSLSSEISYWPLQKGEKIRLKMYYASIVTASLEKVLYRSDDKSIVDTMVGYFASDVNSNKWKKLRRGFGK